MRSICGSPVLPFCRRSRISWRARLFLGETGDGFHVFEEKIDPLDAERDAPAEIARPIDADRLRRLQG